MKAPGGERSQGIQDGAKKTRSIKSSTNPQTERNALSKEVLTQTGVDDANLMSMTWSSSLFWQDAKAVLQTDPLEPRVRTWNKACNGNVTKKKNRNFLIMKPAGQFWKIDTANCPCKRQMQLGVD